MKNIFIFVMLTSVLVTGAATAQAENTVKKIVVTIENMKFSPESISISKSDLVIFENKDLVPHTATANDKSFDSGNIAPGKSWTLKPKATGTVPYKCLFHPQMKATLEIR